jgi:hypothetical protein
MEDAAEDAHLPDGISTASSETSTIMSNLSEDNDIPVHTDLNGLLTWLADGQKRLEEKFQQ